MGTYLGTVHLVQTFAEGVQGGDKVERSGIACPCRTQEMDESTYDMACIDMTLTERTVYDDRDSLARAFLVTREAGLATVIGVRVY